MTRRSGFGRCPGQRSRRAGPRPIFASCRMNDDCPHRTRPLRDIGPIMGGPGGPGGPGGAGCGRRDRGGPVREKARAGERERIRGRTTYCAVMSGPVGPLCFDPRPFSFHRTPGASDAIDTLICSHFRNSSGHLPNSCRRCSCIAAWCIAPAVFLLAVFRRRGNCDGNSRKFFERRRLLR